MGRAVDDVKATEAVATEAGEEQQKDGGLETETEEESVENVQGEAEVKVARADGDGVAPGTADKKEQGEAEAKGARADGDEVAPGTPGAADNKKQGEAEAEGTRADGDAAHKEDVAASDGEGNGADGVPSIGVTAIGEQTTGAGPSVPGDMVVSDEKGDEAGGTPSLTAMEKTAAPDSTNNGTAGEMAGAETSGLGVPQATPGSADAARKEDVASSDGKGDRADGVPSIGVTEIGEQTAGAGPSDLPEMVVVLEPTKVEKGDEAGGTLSVTAMEKPASPDSVNNDTAGTIAGAEASGSGEPGAAAEPPKKKGKKEAKDSKRAKSPAKKEKEKKEEKKEKKSRRG